MQAGKSNVPTPLMHIILEDAFGNQTSCNAMPDSGTSRTIISRRILTQGNISLDASRRSKIRAANSSTLDCAGSALLTLTFDNFSIEIDALIANNLAEDVLISYFDLVKLGVLPPDFPSRNFTPPVDVNAVTPDLTQFEQISDDIELDLSQLVDEFPDVFDDSKVTPIKGDPMKIHLNRNSPGYKPFKTNTARKVPLHFQEEADKTLQWFLDSGVIEKVPDNETTEWCSPGFFVAKPNGKVRLVVDYREINQYIDRPVHPFPSPRDIVRDIKPDSKWFLKMDATQGYYQVPLDDESKNLTTFLLPSGRYRFTRAPMGLSPSSDGFCERTDNILQPVPDLLKIVDDALLQAPTKQAVLQKFRIALNCCRQHNLTLSRSKLHLGKEIGFAGYLIGEDGVKPDPKRVEAITNYPPPHDLTQVRSFLGLCNQLGFFIPDLAQVTKPIRDLLKKNVSFQWLQPQIDAFTKAKEILTSTLLVKPFDSSLQTELLTDAARLGGLGYALIQREKGGDIRLVQCGSRSLSSPETRYATNELEALAIYYAITSCHFYLMGCKFTVVTDHKPLLGTFHKNLQDIDNARLLRFREKLTDYNFDIIWTPGKCHLIADALSRAPVFSPSFDEEVTCNSVLALAVAEDPSLQPLYDAAAEDPDYQDTIEAFLQAKHPKNLPPLHPARRFAHFWDDISLFDDSLLTYKDERIIIPKSFRKTILANLHISHSGISKTRALAQQLYFWPGISKDIADMINSCEACTFHRPSQNEVIHEFQSAISPMQAVSLDLYECAGHDYLVMVDRYSNFLWSQRLNRTTTESVTGALNHWFLEYGYPSTIISDNGPQFRSEFKEYCTMNHIKHLTSSPYNHQSNGLAEAAVKAAKRLLHKSDSLADFKVRLQAWRNVPTTGHDTSPSERFFGRRQRHGIPDLHLAPPLPATPVEREKKLAPLLVGDQVTLQNMLTRKWDQTGTIIEVKDSGLSYSVARDSGGKPITRNRRFILKGAPADSTVRPTDNDDTEVSLRKSARLKKKTVRFSFQ